MPRHIDEKWKQSEMGYREIWIFLNCVSSIDGKHISIKCPPNSRSDYFCYKQFFFIVLLIIMDSFHKLIIVDIGSYGQPQ